MSKPIGAPKVKDNSRRKYKEAEQWMLGKKLGRPKQRWVPVMVDGGEPVPAHWEKNEGGK